MITWLDRKIREELQITKPIRVVQLLQLIIMSAKILKKGVDGKYCKEITKLLNVWMDVPQEDTGTRNYLDNKNGKLKLEMIGSMNLK